MIKNISSTIILLMLLQVYSACNSSTNDPVEITALESFYETLGGIYWKNSTGWLDTTLSYCDWYGIYCNTDCKISQFDLYGNNLSGLLPIDLNKFENLEILYLGINSIIGGLDNLSNLSTLISLDLSENLINDELPSFENLTSLEDINLYQNNIYGTIPESIGLAYNIWYINFDYNQLSGTLPSSISNLNLTYFFLFNNTEMRGSVQYHFKDMAYLSWIILSGCNFSGPGPEFHDNAPIWSLELTNNKFEGPIPSSWHKLSSLTTLFISNNRFSSNLDGLLALKKLQDLYADFNCFTGSLPLILAPELTYLSLAGNNFSGEIPNLAFQGGSVTLYDIRKNPELRATLFALPYARRFEGLITIYNPNGTISIDGSPDLYSFACHPIKIFLSVVLADPQFTYYEYCYCLFINNKPPNC